MENERRKKLRLGIIYALIIIAIFCSKNLGKHSNTSNESRTTNVSSTTELQSVAKEDVNQDTNRDTNQDTNQDVSDGAIANVDSGAMDTAKTQSYVFRNAQLLHQHYDKHGKSMGYTSPEDYEEAASMVVNNPHALHKTESEDGDDVYYVEKTNEFVVVSTDGYIRTYFQPDGGIAYFNRQ